MLTGMCLQFVVGLFGIGTTNEIAEANIISSLVAAVATIVTAIISSASSSSDSDAAGAEAKRLAAQRRADEMRKRRIKSRAARKELALERDKLDLNEKISRENERARREERVDLQKKQRYGQQQELAGIMVPSPEEDTAREEKQKVWGM